MVNQIGAALEGINAAFEITKNILGLKMDSAVSAKVAELARLIVEIGQKLFASKAEQAALVARIDELEAEILRLKEWEHEKHRYDLYERVPGTFTYRIKPSAQGEEPLHELCAHCYQQGVKSLLQKSPPNPSGRLSIFCPHCKTSFADK
jgi:hypothetical protein